MFIIIIGTWTFGLLVRKSSIIKDSKSLMMGSSVVSFIIVLALFGAFKMPCLLLVEAWHFIFSKAFDNNKKTIYIYI